jgi:hypothetical protein
MDLFLIAAIAFFMVNAFVFATYMRKIDLNGNAVLELERVQAADAYVRTAAKVRKARASAMLEQATN